MIHPDPHDTSQTELTAAGVASASRRYCDKNGPAACRTRAAFYAGALWASDARRAVERGGEGRECTEPAEADDRASQTASGGSAAAVRTPTPPSATEWLKALRLADDLADRGNALFWGRPNKADREACARMMLVASGKIRALAAARQASAEKGAR